MARKKANCPLVEGLEITTLAAEGKAMGRWNDVVVFVPLTVPGDVVDVQIRSKRRRFMEGFVVRYVKKSPLRAASARSPCPKSPRAWGLPGRSSTATNSSSPSPTAAG